LKGGMSSPGRVWHPGPDVTQSGSLDTWNKKKPPLGAASTVERRAAQVIFLRRLATPIPTRPRPNSAIVPGSGTVWLEKLPPDWLYIHLPLVSV